MPLSLPRGRRRSAPENGAVFADLFCSHPNSHTITMGSLRRSMYVSPALESHQVLGAVATNHHRARPAQLLIALTSSRTTHADGRRPIYLLSLPIFALGSLGVALSNSLAALIVTRIIQGAGSSAVLSVGAGE